MFAARALTFPQARLFSEDVTDLLLAVAQDAAKLPFRNEARPSRAHTNKHTHTRAQTRALSLSAFKAPKAVVALMRTHAAFARLSHSLSLSLRALVLCSTLDA